MLDSTVVLIRDDMYAAPTNMKVEMEGSLAFDVIRSGEQSYFLHLWCLIFVLMRYLGE